MALALDGLFEKGDTSGKGSDSALVGRRGRIVWRALWRRARDEGLPPTEMRNTARDAQTTGDLAVAFLGGSDGFVSNDEGAGGCGGSPRR